jgi:hypothetical protein
MANLWIIDDAKVKITPGQVLLQIKAPTRSLPRDEAFNVADKEWLKAQMEIIEQTRKKGETAEIPLTKAGSSLRLGGGFLHVQGNAIVVPRRDAKVRLRPLVFCECGGMFEDSGDDYVEHLLTESVEIARFSDDGILYVPQLSGEAARYNSVIEKEMVQVARLSKIPFSTTEYVSVDIVPPTNSVRLCYGDVMPLSVALTAEIDTSLLVCVGILKYPDMPHIRFQDTEGYMKDGQYNCINREIHVIDYQTGKDNVWQGSKVIRTSSLEEELSKIDLEKSGGLYSNEAVQEVVKGFPFAAPALQLFLSQL